MLRVCSAIFEPNIDIKSSNNNLFIAKSIQGNMASNGITNFENFRSILDFYRKGIEEKTTGFDPDNIQELDDLKQKINIFEEIINNSLNELKPFNTEEQFKRQMEELNMNLDEIKNLTNLFLKFKPEDFRKRQVASERELEQQLDSANKALKEAKSEEDIQKIESEKSQIESQIKLKQAEDISKETEAQSKLLEETTKSYTAPVTTTLKIGAQEVFNFASDVGVSGVLAINNFTDSVGDLFISLITKFGYALTILAGSSALLVTGTIGLYTYYKILGYSKNFKNKPAANEPVTIVSKTTPNTIITSEISADGSKEEFTTGIFSYTTVADKLEALKKMNEYYISKPIDERIILYNIQSRGIFAECAKFLGLNIKTPTEVIIQYVDKQSKTKKIRQFSFDYNSIIDPTIETNKPFYESRYKQCVKKLIKDGIIESTGLPVEQDEDDTPVIEELKAEETKEEPVPEGEEGTNLKEEPEVPKGQEEPKNNDSDLEEGEIREEPKNNDSDLEEGEIREEPVVPKGEGKVPENKGGRKSKTSKSKTKRINKTHKKKAMKREKSLKKQRKNKNKNTRKT